MLIPKRGLKDSRLKAFRKWIASFPCMVCGLHGRSQAAHIEKGGMGIKGSDKSCRPLCADNVGYVGCHVKLDQNIDKRWTQEKKQEAIDMPMFEAFEKNDRAWAQRLINNFKRSFND